ncbi:MAG: hypothetical protein ACFFED_12635 [Candidatus Thorarchaeota archaeon]
MSIYGDIKSSFNQMKPFFPSFLLSMIGMIFVMVLIVVVATLPIGVLLWIIGGNYSSTDFITVWMNDVLFSWLPTVYSLNTITALALMGIPLLVLVEMILYTVYGISNDIISTGNTKAENAFSWFKRKMVSFLVSGVIVAIFAFGPPALLGYLFDWLYAGIVPMESTIFMIVFFVVYVYIILGLTRMIIPAVVDGNGIVESIKNSFSLVKSNFTRVFGSWTIYFILLVIWFLPLGVWAGLQLVPELWPGPNSFEFWISLLIGGMGLLFDMLLVLPVMILGTTRIYSEIKTES